jgi:hypothetical protein
MTDLTFAEWVAPIASRFASTRREFTDCASRVLADAWDASSPVEGWRFRDVLAHMAEADTFIRAVIEAVLDSSDTDLRPVSAEREVRIARALERGAELPIDGLIARASREGEFTQELLSRLTMDDEHRQVITSRTNPAPMTLSEFLMGYHHYEEHLQHLLPALATVSVAR